MFDVHLGLKTQVSLADRKLAKQLLAALQDRAQALVPQRFGDGSRMRHVYTPDDLDAVLTAWTDPFWWHRRQSSAQGCFSWGDADSLGAAEVWALSRSVDVDALLELIEEWSRLLTPVFGCLHMLAPLEIERGSINGTVIFGDPQKQRPFFSIATRDLVKYVPDLYWLTVFGEPYVQLFGRDRLLSAPAIVRVWQPNIIAVQLTDSLLDVRDRPDLLQAKRDAVKQHLDANVFFDFDTRRRTDYAVPLGALAERWRTN